MPANALKSPQEEPRSSERLTPDDEAYYGYVEAWRQELELNWSDGYAQMPNAIRNDRTLSHKAKDVYAQLLSHMWFKTDRCWPGQQFIAEATGYSRRSVIRALQELYERGYIEKWRRGLGQTNYYFINPLSFPRSFRPVAGPRTALSLPHQSVIPIEAPELRQSLSTVTRRPVEPYYPEVPSCHIGSASESQQEMPESHTKHTQSNLDPDESKRGYTRSGSAAKLGVEGGKTIRKDTTKGTKGTNEDNEDRKRNQTKSKPLVSQENGGAARAEEVKEQKSKRKKHANGEVPPVLPSYLETNFLAPILLHFCDQSPESSKTSFAWIYDEIHQRGLDEYSETYHDLINEARDETKARASKGLIRGRNRDGSIAMMPYFLSILETNVNAWCKAYDEAVAAIQTQEESANGKPLVDESPAPSVEEEVEHQLSATTPVVEEDPQQASSPVSVEEATVEEPVEQQRINTSDPSHGWSFRNADHYADQLRDFLGGSTYWRYEILPTLCSGRYGFVLIERATGKEWDYATQDEITETKEAIRRR